MVQHKKIGQCSTGHEQNKGKIIISTDTGKAFEKSVLLHYKNVQYLATERKYFLITKAQPGNFCGTLILNDEYLNFYKKENHTIWERNFKVVLNT